MHFPCTLSRAALLIYLFVPGSFFSKFCPQIQGGWVHRKGKYGTNYYFRACIEALTTVSMWAKWTKSRLQTCLSQVWAAILSVPSGFTLCFRILPWEYGGANHKPFVSKTKDDGYRHTQTKSPSEARALIKSQKSILRWMSVESRQAGPWGIALGFELPWRGQSSNYLCLYTNCSVHWDQEICILRICWHHTRSEAEIAS